MASNNDCTIYVVNAYSFSVKISDVQQINLAPGLNNIPADWFDKLISHPDVEMYESLGWIQIFDGRKDGSDDAKTGLVLANAGGAKDLPVSDVSPKTGTAKVRTAASAKPK
jgi:hypothetical protein